MIGLGRMGANMVRRLLRGGHDCAVFDMSSKAVAELVKENAVGTASLAEFAKALTKPRAIWLMVPAGVVDKTIADLLPHLERGDILIDGGNSYYIDDIRRRSEEHTSELQSLAYLVCRLLLEKKKKKTNLILSQKKKRNKSNKEKKKEIR